MTSTAVAMLSGGAGASLLSSWGVGTATTVIGSGVIGGAAGDAAAQTVQIGIGDRSSYNLEQTAWSSFLGGGISYGMNRLLAPGLVTGQIGNTEIGALGEQQAAREIIDSGGNIRAQQVLFRTPEPTASPRADLVIDDASSPSGLRIVDPKTGDAGPTYAQTWGYPYVESGEAVPVGQNAQALGLQAGQALGPTPVEFWQ